MNTQTDILSAQAKMHQAQTSLVSLEDQMASIKSNLLLMTGWDYDSDVTIGAIPPADVSLLDTIDFEADKAIAPKNNYTIIGMRNAAPKDADGDGKYQNKDYTARERGVEQATQQLSITMDGLYLTMLEKKASPPGRPDGLRSCHLKVGGGRPQIPAGDAGECRIFGGRDRILRRQSCLRIRRLRHDPGHAKLLLGRKRFRRAG